MTKFSCKTETQDTALVCRFSGAIDENAVFPGHDGLVASDLIFDFNDVSLINSIGIKAWIEWVSPLTPEKKISLVNCPKAIILQINMVKNFLPQGAKVDSFYLPMFCEDCEKETNLLVHTNTDLKKENGQVSVLPAVFGRLEICPETNQRCEAEPDVIQKKYFRFLD